MLHSLQNTALDDTLHTKVRLFLFGQALEVNLNPLWYGTFAEIGAGQEVARWFFRVGAAAGTIAKSVSAYDMTISDSMYGAAERSAHSLLCTLMTLHVVCGRPSSIWHVRRMCSCMRCKRMCLDAPTLAGHQDTSNSIHIPQEAAMLS